MRASSQRTARGSSRSACGPFGKPTRGVEPRTPRLRSECSGHLSYKVYDPTIQSVNPDGYWYRIASSPWNNAYYSPANTFMNGDPYGGPYTHNTDFTVPNC
jgi:hypothetical protein